MSDPVYCYPPGYTVLKNKFGIQDAAALNLAEAEVVTARMMQGAPAGKFDLAHLQSIHRHLFQDVYDWAGELRQVEISKGGSQFQPRQFIPTGMADVHRRLEAQNYLKARSAAAFAQGAGQVIGDVNYVHPFREGNGRTQLVYLKQLGTQAGHRVDLTRIEGDAWMTASKDAHRGDYTAMQHCIHDAIGDGQSHEETRDRQKQLMDRLRTAQGRRISSQDQDKDQGR